MKSITMDFLQDLPFLVQEEFNRLRVNFGFCGKKYKKIVITSSIPDEGKSFVSLNLWRSLGEAGNKVLLVDADIRRSMLKEVCHIHTDCEEFVGLPHYLAGQVDIDDIVYKTNISNSYMIPVVDTVSNPSILLENGRFSQMLNRLADTFDYILIDTPPIMNVSDGVQISSSCDGVLLVVRSGYTSRVQVASSIKQLNNANCPIIGTVLSRVQIEHSKYYGKYSKYTKYEYSKSK